MKRNNSLEIEKVIFNAIKANDEHWHYYCYPYLVPEYLNTNEKVNKYIKQTIIPITKEKGYYMTVYKNNFALKDKFDCINSEYKGIIYNNYILFLLYLGKNEFIIEYGFEINSLDLDKEIKKLIVEKEI